MLSMLFTYGTLMPSDPESAARDGWEADAVRGRLYDLGPFPALVSLDDPEAGWVEGYVRSGISDDRIVRLDAYEETNGGLYHRTRTITRNNHLVWVYVYGRPLPRDARGPLNRWDGSVRGRFSSLLASSQGDS
ncbi:MAG: gamma-glutamylcyclotransferase [Isosphaeraceae bacterium]